MAAQAESSYRDPRRSEFFGFRRGWSVERRAFADPFLVAGIVLLAGAVLAFVLALFEPMGEVERSAMAASLATAAAATSLPAGILLLNHYRFGGRQADLDAGIVVVLTGALWLLPSRALPVLMPEIQPAAAVLGTGIAVTVLWLVRPRRADRHPDDGALLSLLARARVVATAAATVVAVLALVELATPSLSIATGLESINGLLFGVAALIMLLRGYRNKEWALTFIGMHLLGLEIGDIMATSAPSVTSGLWLGACFISLIAASIGTFGALAVARQSAESRERELLDASLYRVEAMQLLSTNEEQLHDLRSGLLSVEAFASSLERNPSVDLLVEEVARLREMVSATRAAEVLDLGHELSRVATARRALGLDIDLDVEPDTTVLASRSDLLEVVQNLIDNAVSHGHAERIELDARRNGPAVVLRVADDGGGFDEATLPMVFERGYSTNHRGTGLGLHIVSKMVHRMGGTVSAMNRRSGGALIELRLPATEAHVRTAVDVDA